MKGGRKANRIKAVYIHYKKGDEDELYKIKDKGVELCKDEPKQQEKSTSAEKPLETFGSLYDPHFYPQKDIENYFSEFEEFF